MKRRWARARDENGHAADELAIVNTSVRLPRVHGLLQILA